MNQRIYHGQITPRETAQALIAYFHRGNYHTQQIGGGEQIIVQIATSNFRTSGGHTAISVTLRSLEDGIAVQVGKQAWLGVAASLGTTALRAIRNPFSLISRLDDLAQDIESLQLSEEVWQVIENLARTIGTGQALSDRLRRLACEYCRTANPVGASNCIACGAPLGDVQPLTCLNCGFVITKNETICPNCGKKL